MLYFSRGVPAHPGCGGIRAGHRKTGVHVILNPYLHFEEHRIYNPLRDESLLPEDPRFSLLRDIRATGSVPTHPESDPVMALRADEWLIGDAEDLSHRFFLKYVSIETHTVCNQGCYFCPVSVARREKYFMPDELWESILRQLEAYSESIEGISTIQYNEPTVDPRFTTQIRQIKERGLQPAIISNGTGLLPRVVDELMAMGGVRYVSINFSTMDEERYLKERGSKQLSRVLENLRYMKDFQLGREMDITVLGTGDDRHRRDFEEISAEFGGSCFEVRYFEVMNRAGNLSIGLSPSASGGKLCGCEQTGSRPLQWLHVTAQGKVVFCCQDYYEKYVVGDFNDQSLEEILSGEKMARLRRWSYGVAEAPAKFICRHCVYARRS